MHVFQLVKETAMVKSGARAESREILSGLLCCCGGDLAPAVTFGGQQPSTAGFSLLYLGRARQC